MPMRASDYHPEWPSISRQIRDQAGDACEFCGVPNHTWIQRNVAGEWKTEDELSGWNSDAAWHWIGSYDIEPVWIVLTVAHLCDCDKRICSDPIHLRALCQRCHLNHDRPENQRKGAETRRRNRAAAVAATGQLTLIGGIEDGSANRNGGQGDVHRRAGR